MGSYNYTCFALGSGNPNNSGSGTMKKNVMRPIEAMMMPGTMKDMPQFAFSISSVLTKALAIKVPRMLPTQV